jgi:D-glucosaminate-specific PTS system IIB component
MAVITMTRVDARLVHGQVAGRWIKHTLAERIIIIGDEIAKDPFMIEMFQLLSPPGTKILCYTIAQAVEEFQRDEFGDGRIIIMFKEIPTADKAWRAGVKFKEINIGQVPGGPGRKLAWATVSLSEHELALLSGLEKDGVNVYFQAVPDDKQQPLDPIAKKLKF